MSKPDVHRDLEALIRATEGNRVDLKKMQQKVERLEAAILAAQKSTMESEQKQKKRNAVRP